MAKSGAVGASPAWDSIEVLKLGVEQVELIEGEPLDYGFEELVRTKDRLKTMREDLERQEKACADGLLMFMMQAEVQKVALWDGWVFDRREGRGASKIDSTKLLEAGVPLATIQGATVEGKPYTYTQITKPRVGVK